MSHRNRQHQIRKFTPIPNRFAVLLPLPVKCKRRIERISIRICHVQRLIRSHTDQDLHCRINVMKQSLINILADLIQSLHSVVLVILLLDMDDWQTVDQQCRIESAIFTSRHNMRSLDLIDDLIHRVSSANLSLIEHGQKYMVPASTILCLVPINLDLSHTVQTIQPTARFIRRA